MLRIQPNFTPSADFGDGDRSAVFLPDAIAFAFRTAARSNNGLGANAGLVASTPLCLS